MQSRHAQLRAQQRGIPQLAIDLLLQFGATEKAGGGVRKLYFDKTALRRLQAYAGPMAGVLREHLDVYAVVGDDDRIVTVAYRLERIKRH